ncbi:Sad1 / UNC-like protein [Ancylostoma ceylanicum]|uniref:Sad1 / UNC-like protein n=1 Tax=Ancylostoma ceylanicum TaxID=53326 RepID=A0A0D6LQ51_9BILA|nr:Sad1 / UNC-like protein [Ancylostoma ceylanicum]
MAKEPPRNPYVRLLPVFAFYPASNMPYRWKEWRVVRGEESTFIWCDVLALELRYVYLRNANFTIDLGVLIYPTAYTLRHARGYGRSALRNWLLQGSKDKQVWEVLVAHADDTSLGDPGSTATWPIEDDRTKGPFRYLRVAQNGKNSSGQTYYLSISGFEVYGEIVDVVVDGFTPQKDEKDKCAFVGKKSMSTTNLVEDRAKSGPSVASTGQAASAESLQHQTQSLENLLARSAVALLCCS